VPSIELVAVKFRPRTVCAFKVALRQCFELVEVQGLTNAFEVPGIQDCSADNLAAESSLSTIVALPGTTVDSLRAIEAFGPSKLRSLISGS